ncbi:apolipoprotein B receptor [Sus scrofa]|nr:apolipoprotein B receptor [Sus scrofa]
MCTHFPAWTGSSCGHYGKWAGLGVGMCEGETGEEEVSWVLGKPGLSWWVGTVTVSLLDTQTETDRMDFLRLHLPGLHQALRGALDSFSTFVSYLLGDEVPTAERREAWAAEELGEVAAGRLGRMVEEEAQEALEGLGGSQSKGERGLRGTGEAGRCPEGSSATEQTWGGGEGSSHGAQADRQDTGAWEAAKATRCQEFSVPLEARKKPEAGSEAGRDRRSQSQESQKADEQEVNRKETPRTWEWEEEEEFRAAEPGVARGAESEWTWHKEPEGKAGADGQKVAGDDDGSEQVVKEAAAEEVRGPGDRGAGREEEVVVVSGGQSTRAQGTQEAGAESEDGGTSGREEPGTISSREEAGATLGREEAGETSGREEAGTISDREEAGTISDREEAETTSGREEGRTISGREEAGTISDREEAETTSGREEGRTISDREEAETTSGREEGRTISGREEAGTISDREEAGTISDREEAETTSGREEGRTILGREEAETISGREEARAISGREEARAASGREEAGTISDREEAETTSGREEASTTSGREETETISGREEAGATSGREEAGTISGREEAETTSGREEASTTSGREEAETILGREEAGATSGREEARTISDREEAETISGREEADLLAVNETEHGAFPGERTSMGTGRAWALEETCKGDQRWEVDEPREAEVSLFPEQTQALGTEGVLEAAREQRAGSEGEEGQGSEGLLGEGLEVQADQAEEEAPGRQDAETGASQASLQEVVQAEEAKQPEESCWAAEAELLQDEVAKEAEGAADSEKTPEARPQEFSRERGEEEAQMGVEALEAEWGGLEHEVTENQEPELVGGPQAPGEQPEGGQVGQEELWSIPAPGKEETERILEEYSRNAGDVEPNSSVVEAWGNSQRRDEERGNSQEEDEDAEDGMEEAVGGQAVAEAERGRESAPPDILEAAEECVTAKEAWHGAEEGEALGAENQGLGGGHGPAAGTSPSPGESDAGDTREGEGEAVVPWGADRTFRSGWRLQDSKDTEANSLAAQNVEDRAALDGRAPGAGEGPEREAREAGGRGWDSEGRAESGGGEELVEAAEGEKRGWQEFGLEGSAEKGVPGRGGQVEAFEATEGEPDREQVEPGAFAVAEESCGLVDVTSGFQAWRAEGLPGGQILWEEKAGGWQVREQGPGGEGQPGDQPPEGEAQRPLDMEDVQDQKAEAENDPEGLEDMQVQEDQWTNQDLAEAEPGPCSEAAGSAAGDAHGTWSEARLPGSRLDVSIPRSRVFLSRSASQRRSRPSFRRSLAPEQQEEPPSPPPEEELPASEQRLLQPENTPEPSPPRSEGTPLPARRRPLGQGFGLGHPGMMQELRARLGQPKTQ